MERLFALFDEIGFPYFRQGSMSDEEYEPSFFTFWNFDTPNWQVRDNATKSFLEYVQIGFYTNDANNVYSVMSDFVKRAKARGFIVEGQPRDADADKKDYFGRMVYIRIINNTEE